MTETTAPTTIKPMARAVMATSWHGYGPFETHTGRLTG